RVHEHVTRTLLRVRDARADAIGRHRAGVADLTAGLAVERRLVEHHLTALAGLQPGDLVAVAHERSDDALGPFGVVAKEFSGPKFLAQRKPDRLGRSLAGAGPRGARLRLLLFHRGVERVGID